MRKHLTFANVTSLLALFVALGGTSVRGRDDRDEADQEQLSPLGRRSNGSLSTRDVKRGSLGGRAIRESALGTVPRAGRVGGKTAAQLTLKCPAGTVPNMDSCIEPSPRPALAYGLARVACEVAKRRLPSYQELAASPVRLQGA